MAFAQRAWLGSLLCMRLSNLLCPTSAKVSGCSCFRAPMTEAMTGQSSNAQLHATGVDVKVTVNFDAKTLCIELAGASNESVQSARESQTTCTIYSTNVRRSAKAGHSQLCCRGAESHVGLRSSNNGAAVSEAITLYRTRLLRRPWSLRESEQAAAHRPLVSCQAVLRSELVCPF